MRDPVETDLGLKTVEHTRLRQAGYAKALCRDDQCQWKHVATTYQAASAAAVKHVKRSGHEVQVERTQWKIVSAPDV
jgi:hypothetical protein